MKLSAPYRHVGDNTLCWTSGCSLREGGYPTPRPEEEPVVPQPGFFARLFGKQTEAPQPPRYLRTPEGVAFDELSDRLSNFDGLHDYIREQAQRSDTVPVPMAGTQALMWAASRLLASGGRITKLELYSGTSALVLTPELEDTFNRRGIDLLAKDDHGEAATKLLIVDNWIIVRGFEYTEVDGRQVTVTQMEIPRVIPSPLYAAAN